MANNNKKAIFCYAGIAVFTFITLLMIWLVNHNIPFMMDDLWYSTLLYSEEPIKGLSDIYKAQVWHYNNWGGRTITHTILQLVLLCGEKVADILNTVMVLITGAVLAFMSETITGTKRRWSSRITVISLLMGAIHGFNANWKMSLYWEAGAANYLFITVFILLFLWCFIRELSAEKGITIGSLPGIYIWIIPLALITGWSNENMGPTCFIFAIASFVYIYKNTGKKRFWMLEGAAVALIGSIACIIAPGNSVRSGYIEANNYGKLWQVYLRCYSDFNGLLNYLFLIVFTLAALLVIAVGILKIKLSISEIFLIAAGIISWGAMILSPHYPDRASYGSMILFLLAGLSVAKRIVNEKPKSLWGMYLCGGLVWCRGMFFLAEYLGLAWGWIK